MATQKVRPDPGALERQHRGQRRRTVRRKLGVYATVAALVAAGAVYAVQATGGADGSVPMAQPSPTIGGTGDASVPTKIGTVTLARSGCELDLIPGPIEPGLVQVDVVNDTGTRAAFDWWRIWDDYTYERFADRVRHERRLAEAGEPGIGPGHGVGGLRQSGVIPAGTREVLIAPAGSGIYGIACLVPYEGVGIRPFDLVGPISVE